MASERDQSGRTEWPEAIMTNFDHTIDREVEGELRSGKHYAQYAGYDFCGYIWRDLELHAWKCEVWQYRSPVEVITEQTLEEIMTTTSERYGDG